VRFITTTRDRLHGCVVDDHLAYDWIVRHDELKYSTRTNAKDAKGAVERLGRIRRLTDDDSRVAISYPEEDLDKREYCANVGVVTLAKHFQSYYKPY